MKKGKPCSGKKQRPSGVSGVSVDVNDRPQPGTKTVVKGGAMYHRSPKAK